MIFSGYSIEYKVDSIRLWQDIRNIRYTTCVILNINTKIFLGFLWLCWKEPKIWSRRTYRTQGFHGCDAIHSFQIWSISNLNTTAMKLSTIFLYQPLFIILKYSLVNSYAFVPYYDIEQSYEPIQYVDFDLISGIVFSQCALADY